MFLIMIFPRSATVLLGIRTVRNLNILKTNMPDLDILSTPLLDFFYNIHFLKICIRYVLRKKRGILKLHNHAFLYTYCKSDYIGCMEVWRSVYLDKKMTSWNFDDFTFCLRTIFCMIKYLSLILTNF